MKERTLATRRKYAADIMRHIHQEHRLTAKDFVRARKVALRIDQGNMALLMGVGRRATVSAWERGTYPLKRIHWLALYAVLDMWLASTADDADA